MAQTNAERFELVIGVIWTNKGTWFPYVWEERAEQKSEVCTREVTGMFWNVLHAHKGQWVKQTFPIQGQVLNIFLALWAIWCLCHNCPTLLSSVKATTDGMQMSRLGCVPIKLYV